MAYEGIGGPQVALAYYNNDPQNLIFLTGNASNPTVTNDTNAAITGTPPVTTVYRFTPFFSSNPENSSQKEAAIYPNPANDKITVQVNSDLSGSTYTITDLRGRIILTGQINSEKTDISISELPTDMYLLNLGGLNHRTFKVIRK
jgi:hypothetical protein